MAGYGTTGYGTTGAEATAERAETKKERMASRMEMRAEDVERKGTELSQRAAETGAHVSRSIANKMRGMAEGMRNVHTSKYGRAVDNEMAMVKSNIRAHPLMSIAVAMGAGFLLGAAMSYAGAARGKKRYVTTYEDVTGRY